jgi:hypothetical protein
MQWRKESWVYAVLELLREREGGQIMTTPTPLQLRRIATIMEIVQKELGLDANVQVQIDDRDDWDVVLGWDWKKVVE